MTKLRTQFWRLPSGAQGAGREFADANSLLAHAARIEAEIPQKLRSNFEELERIARFLAGLFAVVLP
jgi:hypothetical protein